jgi:hypothetical protein
MFFWSVFYLGLFSFYPVKRPLIRGSLCDRTVFIYSIWPVLTSKFLNLKKLFIIIIIIIIITLIVNITVFHELVLSRINHFSGDYLNVCKVVVWILNLTNESVC